MKKLLIVTILTLAHAPMYPGFTEWAAAIKRKFQSESNSRAPRATNITTLTIVPRAAQVVPHDTTTTVVSQPSVDAQQKKVVNFQATHTDMTAVVPQTAQSSVDKLRLQRSEWMTKLGRHNRAMNSTHFAVLAARQLQREAHNPESLELHKMQETVHHDTHLASARECTAKIELLDAQIAAAERNQYRPRGRRV